MKAVRLQSFKDDFEKLPKSIQQQTKEKFQFFKQDPYHPSLRIKKMKGYENIWEGHITLGYVFTLQWDIELATGEQVAIFRRIGKHDDIYANP